MRVNTREELQGLIKHYNSESDELIDQIYSIMWHMRGSLNRQDAWSLSAHERARIMKQIEERVKTVEKTGLAVL